MNDQHDHSVCPVCGAPATDQGGISQCQADVAHIDVYDLDKIRGPITLRRKPGGLGPRPRPDGLTPGELMALGWARRHSARWGDKGRNMADALRLQLPWLADADLARLMLQLGSGIEHAHKSAWSDLDVLGLARVMKAAAVELAMLELDNPE